MRRGLLIVNPAAGGRQRRLLQITRRIESAGWQLTVEPTQGPGQATTLARQGADDGFDAVFVLGGDGTQREAAAGLIGRSTPLAPLVGGTANVLVRGLGLPRDPLLAAEMVASGKPHRLDAGRCNDELFLMMVSTGLDARVLSGLNPALKRTFGRVGIGLQGLGAWWSYEEPPIAVEIDGREHSATFVALSNIPYYGGPFRLAPGARLDDRKLQVVLYSGRGRVSFLSFLADLIRGRHLDRADTWTSAASSARLVLPRGLGVQVDGDWHSIAEEESVEVRVAAQELFVLAPRGSELFVA